MKVLLLVFQFAVFCGQAYSFELKAGDIILQPLDCFSCDLIRAQEKTEYSHLGIVITQNGHAMVAQALGSVALYSLERFLSQAVRPHRVIRPKDPVEPLKLFADFKKGFEGTPFDSAYLWDDKKFYCSEFIYKLLSSQDIRLPNPKPMQFNINRELWERYFRGGAVPEGKMGISPGEFDHSEFFDHLGYL